jgi:hypothetical protein
MAIGAVRQYLSALAPDGRVLTGFASLPISPRSTSLLSILRSFIYFEVNNCGSVYILNNHLFLEPRPNQQSVAVVEEFEMAEMPSGSADSRPRRAAAKVACNRLSKLRDNHLI